MEQILILADAPLGTRGNGGWFAADFASLGAPIGAKKHGVNLTIVPPQSRAIPKHADPANEEMMFVLDGAGTYHCGGGNAPVRAGDLIGAPAGDSSTAHQIENGTDAELRHLAFSTKREAEVVAYPDSVSFGVVCKAGGDRPGFRVIGRQASAVAYWHGEKE